MGFVLEGLEAEAYDRTYGDATLVRRIAGYFRPHGRTIATVAGMVVLAARISGRSRLARDRPSRQREPTDRTARMVFRFTRA